MTELLMPRTDGGVIVQLVVVVLAVVVTLVALRHRPELRIAVIGLGVLFVSLVGLRALH